METRKLLNLRTGRVVDVHLTDGGEAHGGRRVWTDKDGVIYGEENVRMFGYQFVETEKTEA